jgi:hypothetical protein
MKKNFWFLILFLMMVSLLNSFSAEASGKRMYMWFDCEANYKRLSYPDSIVYYLHKIKDAGFTDAVVDVKTIMGEVVYDSKIAPFMSEFNGTKRDRSYDMLGIFIREGHKMGLRIHASLNIFCGGHNFLDRGIIYSSHPEWQSVVYVNGKLMPISQKKWAYDGMVNPVIPEVRAYEMSILKEFVSMYKQLDGVILDRVRFDGIDADFSQLSKIEFEKYAGITVEHFPEDIITWKQNGKTWSYDRGKYFNRWIEWRAQLIGNFFKDARAEVKKINPKLAFGDYTGAWYPVYYEVGVNWASNKYDPSEEYDWATPAYKDSGYAGLLDIYMTGLYYNEITSDEVAGMDEAAAKSRVEANMGKTRDYWYSVQGGARLVTKVIMGDVPVTGGILVDVYKDPERFAKAIQMSVKETDGVMVFDIVHIIDRGWWNALKKGVTEPYK